MKLYTSTSCTGVKVVTITEEDTAILEKLQEDAELTEADTICGLHLLEIVASAQNRDSTVVR